MAVVAGAGAAVVTAFDAAMGAGFGAADLLVLDGWDVATGATTAARRACVASAGSPSSVGCRAVISAAAAITHVAATTTTRQLYAFGGGGIAGFAATIGFGTATVFDAGTVLDLADWGRALAAFPSPPEIFRKESFCSRRSALSR